MSSSFGTRRLLGRTFSLLAREPRLLALSFVATLPLALVLYVQFAFLAGEKVTGPARGLTLIAVAALVCALQPLQYGAASVLVTRRLDREEAGFGDAVWTGLHGYLRVVGVQLVAVAALAASAALVVPALLIAAGWCAAAPAAALERLGPVAALRRSWSQSRGHRWALLVGVAVAYAVVGLGLVVVAFTIAVSLPDSGDTTPQFDGLGMAALVAVPGVLGAVPCAVSAVAYHGLRDGNETASLASVFE